MARRLALLAAVLGVLALVVSMVVPAVAENGEDRVTLRLAEKTADDEQFTTFVDVGKKGDSPGDYEVLQGEPVYNRSLTKQVGVVRGDVMLVSIEDGTFTGEVDVTFDLEGGLITVEGPITFSKQNFEEVQEFAVTGGTNAYKTAHGELAIDLSDPEGFHFTFRLIL